MARMTTLLDLVDAVAEYAGSDAELIATVVYMVNRGHVRLCGTFKGSRFDLASSSRAWIRREERPCRSAFTGGVDCIHANVSHGYRVQPS